MTDIKKLLDKLKHDENKCIKRSRLFSFFLAEEVYLTTMNKSSLDKSKKTKELLINYTKQNTLREYIVELFDFLDKDEINNEAAIKEKSTQDNVESVQEKKQECFINIIMDEETKQKIYNEIDKLKNRIENLHCQRKINDHSKFTLMSLFNQGRYISLEKLIEIYEKN